MNSSYLHFIILGNFQQHLNTYESTQAFQSSRPKNIIAFLKNEMRVLSCFSEPFHLYSCKIKPFLVTTHLSLV